jgi:hypothetical protein
VGSGAGVYVGGGGGEVVADWVGQGVKLAGGSNTSGVYVGIRKRKSASRPMMIKLTGRRREGFLLNIFLGWLRRNTAFPLP